MYDVFVGPEQLLFGRAAHDSPDFKSASGGASREAGSRRPHHGHLGAPPAGPVHPVGHSGRVPHDLSEYVTVC